MTVDYRVGDVRDVMATIPDGSVSLVATSPPFLALRSYLPAGHDAKHAEIGSEANPAAFLDTLLGLTAEWGRVLAPWGSIAIELGDTYSGKNGWGDQDGNDRYPDGRGMDLIERPQPSGPGWPRAKSLALIPQLYAIALAYGINPLTGQPSPAGQWLVRNVIVWHRPNPAVGALGDKFRPSTSYITVATRSNKRWFDLTAVRTATDRFDFGGKHNGRIGPDSSQIANLAVSHAAGAPPLDTWLDHHDTWTLTTQPSSLAHYAMWPAKLAERLILSMCPLEVCSVCGEPRRRVEGEAEYTDATGADRTVDAASWASAGVNGNRGKNVGRTDGGVIRSAPTLGWTDCGHNNYHPGLVLDPFAGTGTTLAVADLHGRDAIGIDIDHRNHHLYPRRYDEVKKALYGTQPEMPGQMEMFA